MKKDKNIHKQLLNLDVEDYILSFGKKCDNIIFSTRCDMNNNPDFSDIIIAFDGKKIFVAEGSEGEIKSEKKFSGKVEVTVPVFEIKNITEYENVEEIKVENYNSVCRLVASVNGEDISLCFFTLGMLERVSIFTEGVNEYLQTGNIKVKEDPEDNKCEVCGRKIEPNKTMCKKCSRKRLGFTRIFSFFKGHWIGISLIVMFMLIKSGIALVVPQISTRTLYDNVLNPGNTAGYENLLHALYVTVGTILGIKVLNTVVSVVAQYVTESILPHVIFSIKKKVFESMQNLSLSFYTSKQTGSLMERVSRDSNHIYFFMVDGLPELIVNAITVTGILVIMFKMSWKLALLLICCIPFVVLFFVFFDKKFRSVHHRVWLRNSSLTSSVSDRVNGHRIIKSFAKEDEEAESFKKTSTDLCDAEIKKSKMEAIVFPIFEFIIFLVGAGVFYYGAMMTLHGEITVGVLMTFVVYIEMLKSPIGFLSRIFTWWERCLDSSQRVFEIIDAKPDIVESENPVILDEVNGEIEIKNVDFEYEIGRLKIKDLSLKIEAGTMLGIVGKTGAGKSTLVNLIARLYDTKNGNILIDGVNVRDLTFSQLRRNIGMVSQDIFLFMGSIADNIRYANPDADMTEVIAAAKAAGAHDFIMKLPDGYETRVGSGGQDLSGGERQRISIARTIMQNPKILILDEATAAMDTETERKIQNSISELKSGRTTIAIAHRLSTLKDADKIAVISKGEMVEYGTFEELIKLKGEYYNLYKIQNDLRKQMVLGAE